MSILANSHASLDLVSGIGDNIIHMNQLGNGVAPIHIAANKGIENIVEFLLLKGADVTTQDESCQVLGLFILCHF